MNILPAIFDGPAERTNMYEMRPTPHRRLYRPGPEDVQPFVPPD